MEGVSDRVRNPVGRLEIIEKDSANRGQNHHANAVSLHSRFPARYDLTPGQQLIIGRNKAAWQGPEIKWYCVI